jgi:Tfp pilus assembly protein PilN
MSITTKTVIKEEIINLETDISYLQRDLQARYEADKIIAEIQRLEAERRQLLDRLAA